MGTFLPILEQEEMNNMWKVHMHCLNVKMNSKGTIKAPVRKMGLGAQVTHVLVIILS